MGFDGSLDTAREDGADPAEYSNRCSADLKKFSCRGTEKENFRARPAALPAPRPKAQAALSFFRAWSS